MKKIAILAEIIGIVVAAVQIVGCSSSQETTRKHKEMARQQAEIERLRDQHLKLEQNWTKLHVGLTASEVEKLIGPFGKDDIQWDMVQQAALLTAALSTHPQDSGESMAVYRGQRFKLVFINGKLKSWDSEFYVKSPTAKLALKFTPGDSTTYKIITETTRQAAWEGLDERKPAGFKGGQSGNKIEMTFKQNILSTNKNGNAIARITIEKLRYLTKVVDNIILDFDSTTDMDLQDPLSRLIGHSYIIELTPSGRVANVVDANDALAAISDSPNRSATQLLTAGAITERHTIPALPIDDKTQINVGDSWEVVKDISFDQMGVKSFGKTYTLENIQDTDNRRIAAVRMNAIPSVENAKELYQAQTLPFPHDSTETYSGKLKLDLESGKVKEYNEKLTTEWIIIDPASKNNERPDAIKMSATQSYSIEKID